MPVLSLVSIRSDTWDDTQKNVFSIGTDEKKKEIKHPAEQRSPQRLSPWCVLTRLSKHFDNGWRHVYLAFGWGGTGRLNNHQNEWNRSYLWCSTIKAEEERRLFVIVDTIHPPLQESLVLRRVFTWNWNSIARTHAKTSSSTVAREKDDPGDDRILIAFNCAPFRSEWTHRKPHLRGSSFLKSWQKSNFRAVQIWNDFMKSNIYYPYSPSKWRKTAILDRLPSL